MARKRKIPARKHHGVRDPLKQQEERDRKLEKVINNPPEQGNDQKESFKFIQFKKLVDNAKAGKKLKRIPRGQEDKPKKNKRNKDTKSGSNDKFKNIKPFADETDASYMRRVNRITAESLREAQYEAKYGVTVEHNSKTGEISVKKRPKHELDVLLEQKIKAKRNKGKVGKKPKETKPVKELMDVETARQLIKQAIKEDKEERIKDTKELSEFKRDVVKFGEVVHAPPTISTLPRKAEKSDTVPRPGKKNNLLLKTLMDQATTSSSSSKPTKTIKKSSNAPITKIQLKGKRRDLPAATRFMLENEQSKFVELYRQLKKSKVKSE